MRCRYKNNGIMIHMQHILIRQNLIREYIRYTKALYSIRMLNFLALPDHPYTTYYCVRLAWFWARTVEHWANLMSIMETKCKVEFLVFHKTTKVRVRTENIKQYASKSYGGRWGVDIHVNCFTMYVMSARSSINGITMGWHKEWS